MYIVCKLITYVLVILRTSSNAYTTNSTSVLNTNFVWDLLHGLWPRSRRGVIDTPLNPVMTINGVMQREREDIPYSFMHYGSTPATCEKDTYMYCTTVRTFQGFCISDRACCYPSIYLCSLVLEPFGIFSRKTGIRFSRTSHNDNFLIT